MDFYKLELADLLVVCDDFNLPLGKLRFRSRGSAGGQKGLGDIISQLGSEEFSRLRIGIGPVPDQWDPADFVLGRFAAERTGDDRRNNRPGGRGRRLLDGRRHRRVYESV